MGIFARLTRHASTRIYERLNPLVTEDEVLSAVNAKNLPLRKCGVKIKSIGYTEIQDPNVYPDGIARGDILVAIVESGAIKTVELRKSWSKSAKPEYNEDYYD
jgi:hypothetical protein